MVYQVGVTATWSKCEDPPTRRESKRRHLLNEQGTLFFTSSNNRYLRAHNKDLRVFCDSLLSSCSSFRDSAYQEQDQQNVEVSTMTLDDGTDLNGIDKIFEGIPLYQLSVMRRMHECRFR